MLVHAPYFKSKHKYFKKEIPTRFAEFVDAFFNASEPVCDFTDHHMLNQCDWIMDENDTLLVDFVGKLETLQTDFNQVCGKLGINPQRLPNVNRSKRFTKSKKLSDYYDRTSIKIVEKYFKRDIDTFNYGYEGTIK